MTAGGRMHMGSGWRGMATKDLSPTASSWRRPCSVWCCRVWCSAPPARVMCLTFASVSCHSSSPCRNTSCRQAGRTHQALLAVGAPTRTFTLRGCPLRSRCCSARQAHMQCPKSAICSRAGLASRLTRCVTEPARYHSESCQLPQVESICRGQTHPERTMCCL